MTIKRQYVSIETANLLKDEGFDFDLAYSHNVEIWEVVEWFRIVHNIWIYVERGENPDNYFPNIQTPSTVYYSKYYPNHWRYNPHQAYLIGIEIALTLIKED